MRLKGFDLLRLPSSVDGRQLFWRSPVRRQVEQPCRRMLRRRCSSGLRLFPNDVGDSFDPVHQGMNGEVGMRRKAVLGGMQRPRDETDLPLTLVGIVANTDCPVCEDPRGGRAGLGPVLKVVDLAGRVVEPVGIMSRKGVSFVPSGPTSRITRRRISGRRASRVSRAMRWQRSRKLRTWTKASPAPLSRR